MTSTKRLKVCLFTASSHRPIFLRHCIFQLQQQTYPHHHSIYVNSNHFKTESDSTNYLQFVSDIRVKAPNKIFLGYGKTRHQHDNHMEALNLVKANHYDLYLKVDDDDIYFPNYIENVVTSYLDHKWDISGSYSDGIINKNQVNRKIKYLALNTHKDNPLHIMPGTLAFSFKAINYLKNEFNSFFDPLFFEDEQWIKYLCSRQDIQPFIRTKSNYVYHIHDTNICKPKITSS